MDEFRIAWSCAVAISCGGETADSGEAPASGLPDDPETACVETNEDCAPGTCGMDDATMLAGSNCLACHGEDTRAEGAALFTLGGTVYDALDGTTPVEGAVVRATDEAGLAIELVTDGNGNFHTSIALDFPLAVDVGGEPMTAEVHVGACGACHRCGGTADGKVWAP